MGHHFLTSYTLNNNTVGVPNNPLYPWTSEGFFQGRAIVDFCSGWPQGLSPVGVSGREISFYQLETKRKHFSTKVKHQVSKSLAPLVPTPCLYLKYVFRRYTYGVLHAIVFDSEQRGNEGAQRSGRRITGEKSKSHNNVACTSFSTAHLLAKHLRFEHGIAKLVSCPGRHLTSVRPW